MLFTLVTLLYLLIAGLVLALLWRLKRANPFFWFIIFQSLIAIGTFRLVDFSKGQEVFYVLLFFVSLLSFSSAGIVVYLRNSRAVIAAWDCKNLEEVSTREKLIVYFIFITSVIATFAYYWMVGTNVLILMIAGNVIDDYSTLRLSFYSGDSYYAPGYFNQFKNVLLPASSVIIFLWLKGKARLVFGVLVAPILMLALLGTGQRAFLVQFFLSALFVGYLMSGRFRINYRVFFSGGLILFLFLWFTSAYKSGQVAGSLSILVNVLERVFFVQQEGGLLGFNVIFDREIVWFREWYDGLRGLLPGSPGSLLAHEIHEVKYGSFRGTVPVSNIASAYYNGGVLCVVLFFMLLGVVYSLMYFRLLKGRKSVSRVVIYGFVFYFLASYVSDSLKTLIDNGVISLIMFRYLLKIRWPLATVLHSQGRADHIM